MKYFKDINTLEKLRRQYKDLLKIHHPDNVNGSTAATQEINAEYDRLFKVLKDKHEKTADSKENDAKTDFNNMKYDGFIDTFRVTLGKCLKSACSVPILGLYAVCMMV